MTRTIFLLVVLMLAGCAGQRTQPPVPVAGDARDAPVTRRPVEAPTPPAAQASPSPGGAYTFAVPPNTLYVCVAGNRETAIEFAPKVASLCSRHPEMGPCQYERDMCRRNGGRVYAANGQEITRQIEDEYDRKVLRVRFRAN